MRVDLKRFLFVGASSVKGDFLRRAQKVGIIQFIEGAKSENLSDWTKKILAAIKILHEFPPQAILTEVDSANEESIVLEILALSEKRKKDEELMEHLEVEKAELAPFGAFDQQQLRRIEEKGQLTFQFFALKKGIEPPPEFVLVHSGEELDSYVRIGKNKLHLPNAIEIPTTRTVADTEKEYQTIRREHEATEKRLEHLTSYRDFLLERLVIALNQDAYSKAMTLGGVAAEGKAFSLIGWVPTSEISALYELAEKAGIFVEEVAIKENETVPTYLKNEKWARVGQDLVGIYDTPSAADHDPSLWVLVFFTLFFSMIISDAGYGLVFLLIALFIRWKAPNLQGLKKRVLNLFTLLSCGCVVWGILAGSYFGLPLAQDSPLQKISLIHHLAVNKAAYHLEHRDDIFNEWVAKVPALSEAKSGVEALRIGGDKMVDRFKDQIVLELALFVGTLHLVLSMARYAGRNWALFGWILFLIGGYLYVPPALGYTSLLNFEFGLSKELMLSLGKDMSLAGLVIMFVLAIVQHKWKGLLEIMTVITIFADTLSYLRIYALGLAGGIMSKTIFEMSQNLPLFFAVIVMILAHTLNMGLGVMGGVIHGLRLNFLEWYHYSFEGGGKPFRPLKELQKEK